MAMNHPGAAPEITAEQRGDVLYFASSFTTDRADPVHVAGNAVPLLEWLEQAAGDRDVVVRIRAMRQHRRNILDALGGRDEVMDKPAVFLRGAQVLYDFMTAGEAGS